MPPKKTCRPLPNYCYLGFRLLKGLGVECDVSCVQRVFVGLLVRLLMVAGG